MFTKFSLNYVDNMFKLLSQDIKFEQFTDSTQGANLVTPMKEKFGNEMTVIMGDWSDAGHTMKFQTSSKTKGWQTIFKRNKIDCFLIDEFKTSSICTKCNDKIENNIKSRPSSRPWQRVAGKVEKVHGLLGCNNLKCKKQGWTWRLWNRDTLATCNMIDIIQHVLEKGQRPEVFCRKN